MTAARSKTPSGTTPDLPEDTRERLIAAATPLFAKKGFDGVSVKELAEAADVNVSLVSYHFGGKENLYRACLEQFGQARLAVAQRVLQPPQTLDELRFRLKMFLEEIFSAHVEETCAAQIIHRECEMELPVAQEVFKNTFMKVFGTLVAFFESAQKHGIVRADLDPMIVTVQVMGGAIHIARSDKIGAKYFGRSIADPAYREKVIEHLLTCSIYGFAVPGEPRPSDRPADRSSERSSS
jgi:TetR/AcrR family transcriptional regulator